MAFINNRIKFHFLIFKIRQRHINPRTYNYVVDFYSSVDLLIEFKKYVQFYFDYYLKKFGEEPVILPAIYEKGNIEIDLVIGESSGKILGIRYYTNAEETEDDEGIPEEIHLLDEHQFEEDQNSNQAELGLVEDCEEKEDIVWDFCLNNEKVIHGVPILSFIFRFDEYFSQAENKIDETPIENINIPKEILDKSVKSEGEDFIIRDPIIKIEIFSAKNRPIAASIKQYVDNNKKEGNLIGNYILDGELFRRQIFF